MLERNPVDGVQLFSRKVCPDHTEVVPHVIVAAGIEVPSKGESVADARPGPSHTRAGENVVRKIRPPPGKSLNVIRTNRDRIGQQKEADGRRRDCP